LFRCRLSHTGPLGGVSGRAGGQRGQRDGWIVVSYRVLCFECHRHRIPLPRTCRFRIRCQRVVLRRMYSAVRKRGPTVAYRKVFALRHGHSPSSHRHHDPCGPWGASAVRGADVKCESNRQREDVPYVITNLVANLQLRPSSGTPEVGKKRRRKSKTTSSIRDIQG
jgi:hypothetical protein